MTSWLTFVRKHVVALAGAVLVFSAVGLVAPDQASAAQPFFGGQAYGRSYGYSARAYRTPQRYRHDTSHYDWHDTSHWDRHGDHAHFHRDGHYDVHRQGHYDYR